MGGAELGEDANEWPDAPSPRSILAAVRLKLPSPASFLLILDLGCAVSDAEAGRKPSSARSQGAQNAREVGDDANFAKRLEGNA